MPATSPTASTTFSSAGRGAEIFTYGAWAILLAFALRYSLTYGFGVPYYDEWGFVDQLTGKNITFEWLWEKYGDHRLPLAKPIWLFWIKLSNSFRVGVLVNIMVLSLLAIAMIRAAKKVRGRASFADAFFPLVMLHLGQGVNFLWSYQISEMLPVFLECVVIVVVASQPRFGVGTLLAIGASVVALALAGPGGLPFALSMVLWLLLFGFGHWRENAVLGVVSWLFALATGALIGLYFRGFKGQEHALKPTAEVITNGALEFLSVSAGSATRFELANVNVAGVIRPAWWYAGLAVLVFLLSGVLLAGLAWLRRPDDRWRALSVLAMCASGLALALGMGVARGPYGEGAGLSHWYAIFGFPALCSTFFSWVLYGPATLSELIQMCLFTVMCGLAPLNFTAGQTEARERGKVIRDFRRDLDDGLAPILLAEKHGHALSNAQVFLDMPALIEERFRQLKEAQVGPFRFMRGPFIDPTRAISVPLQPVRTSGLTWKNGTAVCTDDDPRLIFALKQPVFVSAIRLGFTFENTLSPARCEFYWCRTDRNGFTESERYRAWDQETAPRGGEDPNYYKDIVINDWVDRIRIDPNNRPCVFHLNEITLLVPANP